MKGEPMSEVLHARKRSEVGSNAMKRVRAAGDIPAVLYGHGEANVNLSISASEVETAIRHGAQMVTLDGDVKETALIRDIQWDPFGADVLHIDLARVSASESVQVTVSLELRGEAPGVKEGGTVELLMHEVEIQCPAAAIPEKLEIRVHELQLGNSVKLSEIPLPEGASFVAEADEVVAHCVSRVEEVEEEEGVSEGIEPEVIGRKAEEDGDEAS
jgi:large subunit ribosomal protein L25